MFDEKIKKNENKIAPVNNKAFESVIGNVLPKENDESSVKPTYQATLEEHEPTAKTNSKKKQIQHIVIENIKNEFGIGMIKIIFNPHWIIKIFWTLLLFGSLDISVYLITNLFIQFFRYDVTTSRKQIFETPTQFSQVNICNQNPLTIKYGYIINLDPNFPNDLAVLNATEQQLLSHSLSDILLSCTFNNLPCYPTDFVWYLDRNWGNCWAFNSGYNASGQTVDLLTSIRAGADYGLQMVLYSNFYENLTSINPYNGLIVKLANASFIDLSDGVYLSSGFVTNVAIDRFFELLLPNPIAIV